MMLRDSGARLDMTGDDASKLLEQSETTQRSTPSSVDNGEARTASIFYYR